MKQPFTIICTFWAGQSYPDNSTAEQMRTLGAAGAMNVTLKTWQKSMLTLTAHAPTDGEGGLHPDTYHVIERYMKRRLIEDHGRDNISGLEITVFEPFEAPKHTAQS